MLNFKKGHKSIGTLYVFLHCVRCCFYLRLFSSQKGAKDRKSSSNLIATLSENALLLLLFEMLHVDLRNLFILIFLVFFLILLHGERRRRINTAQHNIKISFR